ncbi:hypothetical protein Tsubulata_015783 [Turnera subulata]|uniref:RING-type domain-containing protein n=1 Tax=Turnera subulata TaxID=218843 RepID=A0A9Q0FSA2_9ROSI|nr:hypothetical protein Tsubulata_015783 [Turnera subulata]
MGSGSSRPGSRPPRPRVNHRTTNRSKLISAFICGGSSSRSTLEMNDFPDNVQSNSPGCRDSVTSEVCNATEVSSLTSAAEIRQSGCDVESGVSSEISVLTGERILGEDSLRNHQVCNGGKFLSESKGLVSVYQVSDGCSNNESYRNRSSTEASTSFHEHQSSDPVSINISANNGAVDGIDNSEDKVGSHMFCERRDPSSSCPPGNRDLHSDGRSTENHMGVETTMINSNSNSVPRSSNDPLSFHVLRDDSARETIPSDVGLLMSSRERGREEGSILHVDVVSISSSIFSGSTPETSTREARSGRRLFWDAFSRHSSRRNIDSPTITFSADDTEDISPYDRWLLDLGGDIFDGGIGSDSGYLGSRIHRLNEQRRHSRSEIWERLRGGLHDYGRWGNSCPSGLHPDGACSCESFLTNEETSTRASISRIVMLAEALFEVLDEIHRQPVSLSLLSHPAPESVVDSFPLKNHKKVGSVEGDDDAEQCYICLAEYEEGDKIRVLPCHHEYHMACVDKWLKEIHGVCPLCRGDVRQAAGEQSASLGEIPST